MAKEVVILMNDCRGIKLPGRISSTVGRIIPTLSNPSPCNVLRGELLVPIRDRQSGQNDGRPQANHFVKKDPTIILYCKAEEVSPLDQQDSWLLEGIESVSARHTVFIEGKKLEWGSHLEVNDTLYAIIPGPNPVVRECATAIVRYIGPVRGLPGYQFGIEIIDDAFRGNGTTDGTFNGQRYFMCEDKCGRFNSLDKISIDPIPVCVQGQHKKVKATTSQSYASALGKDPPANKTRSKRGEESITDPPSKPCQFNMNEKVIVYDKRGNKVHGTVRWCGRNTKTVTFDYMVLGIATESKVSFSDFVTSIPGLTHLITAPKGYTLFLPESLVYSREEKHLPETKKASDADLNSSIGVAKAFGLTKEELMREHTEGMQQAKQNLAAKDATRGSNRQQGAPPQGGTYTPRVENLRKQKSRSADDYELIPGLEKPTPVERGKHHVPRQSPSIENWPNVQDVSSWQLEQQKHDILHKSVSLRQQQPDRVQHSDSSPGYSSTHDQHNQHSRQSLNIGSTIQIPSTERDHPMRYGVIRWIGELPGVQGFIAGIELEEVMEGCTDGTWATTGQAFFHCPPGKGLYYPLYNLQLDSRYLHPIPGSSLSYSSPHQSPVTPPQQLTRPQSSTPLEIERIKQENASLIAEKATLSQVQNELKQEIVALKKEKEETLPLKNQIEDLQTELRAKSQQLSTAIQENEYFRWQTEQLNEQLQNLQRRLDESNAETMESRFTKVQIPLQNQESWNVRREEVVIQGNLGAGAWGAVCKGIFRGQQVAVKQAHQQILHENTIDQLKREIRIMAHVQHPNLVRLIAAVVDDKVERCTDTPLLVLELLGINLRKAYKERDLTGNNLVSIFRDIAYALHYLHEHQEPIIHRDVSAPNVLLEEVHPGIWRAKLSDFGSANLVKQSKTAAPGALIYSAPETFPPRNPEDPLPKQTTKIDVFSYGYLLAEVIAKEMPVVEKRRAMLAKIERQWKPMYDLIKACIKDKPEERLTMTQVLEKLNG